MKKKFLCLVLAFVMLMSLAACGGKDNTTPPADNTPAEDTTPADDTQAPEETSDYHDVSVNDDEIYDMVFGEFYDAYMAAKEAPTVSERFAQMAIAEAKMLETAVMVPKRSLGGGYAMARVVPYTKSPVLWGHDEYRLEKVMTTEEPIRSEDISALRSLYGELKGTGTYLEQAKAYMEEHGYTLKDTYNSLGDYNADVETWDILATDLQACSEFICKTEANPIQYDVENVMQPNLAESWETSEDGLTVTLHIRQGVQWVDSQGRKVADLVADDWVAAMQHMLDTKGGLEYLVDGLIEGATEYINGESTDFETVGVKAPDDYTLVYTLTQPASYFMTMMNYSIFAPMSRSYYTSQGGKFGTEFDAAAADYNYGKSPDNIAYCGPYLITNYTPKNTIVYQANPTYWDAANVNAKTLTFMYYDASDVMRVYNEFMAGNCDSCGLTAAPLEQAKADTVEIDGETKTVFDAYHFQSATNATAYMGFMNLNRKAFANYNDATKAVSTKTDEDNARTHAAMLNQHFRMALVTGLDRGSHNAQQYGEELKLAALINSYTPGDFVSLDEEVTIDINGTSKTYPVGTNYGVIVQDQITADGYPMKVYDPTAADGAGASSGFDGWYNPEYAESELAKAVEELAADGLEITAENPILIDFPYAQNSEVFTNMAHVVEQCWNGLGGGLVKVNLVACADTQEWYDAGYFPKTGADMNFDYADTSGWGPDYGDPCSYLDTLLPAPGTFSKEFGLY